LSESSYIADFAKEFDYTLAMFPTRFRDEPILLDSRPATRSNAAQRGRFVTSLLVIAVVAIFQIGCSGDSEDTKDVGEQGRSTRPPSTADMAPEQLDNMLLSEELIEGFRSDMGALAFAARNLELPDARTRKQFRTLGLRANDLAPEADEPDPDPTLRSLGLSKREWPLVDAPEATNLELSLWRPLFDIVDHFHWSKFKIKSGHFVEGAADDTREFEAKVNFSALAELRSGELSWIRSTQMITWRLIPGTDPEKNESWRISAWHTKSANRIDAVAPFFEDVVAEAVPDLEQRERARLSIHERLVAERILAKRSGEDFAPPHPIFTDLSNDRHPGLAVVDLDSDGFDDLYVVTRWGRNQFLHNRGDGTFEEKAAAHGLDVEGFSSSAIFADFDNDGDPDLFLGRTAERSAYYENEDGQFVDRSSEKIDVPLPYLASSVSATDYDGDGLLDIYVSTYAASLMSLDGYEKYLSPDELADLAKVWRGHSTFLELVGPANVLLHNQGEGRFSRVKDPGDLAAYRNTYQATWADFDADGDPDVYLSNDFSPDSMIRNDGEGRFVEATGELGFSSFGLGMGSSWGDYDRDGRQDVYVSNMYSTAGSRITAQLPYVDDRYREMAKGNYLYKNEGGNFRKVSGQTSPDIAVERTGWSWASQFIDFDNDGYLDLGVLNGFYTAPREVALSGDT